MGSVLGKGAPRGEKGREMARRFFACQHFAVVGASADRAKFGFKVLRKYKDAGLPVVPVHPKLTEIDGIEVKQLADLAEPETYGVSIVTPPAVSLKVIQDARELGFKHFWLQPGAEDKALMDAVAGMDDIEVIAGGPCILVAIDRGEHKLSSM